MGNFLCAGNFLCMCGQLPLHVWATSLVQATSSVSVSIVTLGCFFPLLLLSGALFRLVYVSAWGQKIHNQINLLIILLTDHILPWKIMPFTK